MLILARKVSQTIMVGDDVKITVLDVQGQHVRIGIDAPRSIEVHRKEIYDRIHSNDNSEGVTSTKAATDSRP